MIINTGQRTDIPAFYSKWFINRIREQYVLVRNPYYPSRVTKYILDPSIVDVIGFCTKNPHPMLKYLDELKDYKQFWYITITPYYSDLEPNVPKASDVIRDFKYLSNKLGANAVGWRYTPIIINEKYSVEAHIKAFEYIAGELEGYTRLVAFGFLDLYDKLRKRAPELIDTTDENKIIIAKKFKEIALRHHLELRLCSKEKWLSEYGIDTNGCMRLSDYENAAMCHLSPKKKMEARKGYCSCMLSSDIGAYNSCPHFCKYCYANAGREQILKNYHNHDDNSPFLIGNSLPGDIITEYKEKSWRIQANLFDEY